jgi:peptide/nickel transport system permease protein
VIGLVANGLALLIGTAVGVTAGYFRGIVGSVLMRFTDLMMAFPALLLAICLAAIFTPSLWIVALVIALVNWVQVRRVLYTETTSLAERDFVAGRARHRGGARAHPVAPHPAASPAHDHRLRHPRHLHDRAPRGHALVPRHRRAAAGSILGQHHLREPDLLQAAPWLVVFPGLAILLLALAFNLLGDALRDVLDPTQRGRA